ncbi:hypothetical protein BC834DRAFT_461903 [Gloeopeniophorella convolvens]|nr:hypothetical protein BC834DRAFT_461903 [Gloeopeniophorella convolvens]
MSQDAAIELEVHPQDDPAHPGSDTHNDGPTRINMQTLGNKPPNMESGFTDGSGALFSMYLERAEEEDKKLTEGWKGDADGILVFTGLFSATVATFLGISLQSLQQNSQDISAFYLAHLYQLNAANAANGTPPSLPSTLSDPTAFSVSASAIWVNALWFVSLVMSLTCALLATLLQQWARRYLRLTRPRYSLHRRARIRAFYAEGVDKLRLPTVVEALPGLLHASVFIFFAGLIVFLSTINHTVFVVAMSCVATCVGLYLCVTVMPLVRHDSPYNTPLSTLFWTCNAVARYAAYYALERTVPLFKKALSSFRRVPFPPHQRNYSAHFRRMRSFYKLSGGMDKESAGYAEGLSWEIDARSLKWTLACLDEDHELEQFIAGLPVFYGSTALSQPAEVVTMGNTEASDIIEAILGLMDRSLTSDLVSESTRRRRSTICLKVLKLDSFILEHFIFRAHQFTGFKWVEFGLAAEQYQRDRNSWSHQAALIIALVTKNVRGADERWLPVMIRQLNVSASDLRELFSHGDDLLFANLIRFTQWIQMISSWHAIYSGWVMGRSLDALQEFDVTNTSTRLQHEFCSLWNQLLLEELREPGWQSRKPHGYFFTASALHISLCTQRHVPH